MWQTYLVVALVAYLLGSIPFGYILVKLFLKQDIRQTGSGNIGATNVARSGRKGLAIATLLLDAAKGAAAVSLGIWAAHHFGYPGTGVMDAPLEAALPPFAALMSVLGHVFPVWLKFKGGKGVATAVGSFLVLSPLAVAICLLVFAIIFAVFRYVSLASVISSALFPFIAMSGSTGGIQIAGPLQYGAYSAYFYVTLAASLLIILKHHGNIRRLLKGTEPKFTTKKAVVPADPIQVEKNA